MFCYENQHTRCSCSAVELQLTTNIAAYYDHKHCRIICVLLRALLFSQDRQSRDDMLGHMRNVSVASSKLLLATKALAVDPNAPNVQNQLASAARGVTDAINSLLNMCQSYGPGQRECDNALRNIEVRPWQCFYRWNPFSLFMEPAFVHLVSRQRLHGLTTPTSP